ncbi:ADP-heptose:LPS heptosyltransferase [Oxalobacteraceae bacterium GrIS 1.11]
MGKFAKIIARVFLGKSGKIPFDAANIKRILILRNDKIGDMIVSTPLFRELKKNYPQIVIDVAASSVNRDILDANPHIAEVIIWDKKGAANDLKTILKIRTRQYDLIFSTSNMFSLPFLMRIKLLGAKYLVGFNNEKYQVSTKSLGMFDHTVDCDKSRPILDSYFSAFAHFKLEDIDRRYELFEVDAHAAKSAAFLAGLRSRYRGFVCLNCHGSGANRTLGALDAQAICAQLAEKYPDLAIIVIYPPGGKQAADDIVQAVGKGNVLLSFETRHILELAALIRECEIVISPDTSVIHLASVFNKKTLGFYINTDNYKWFYPACDSYRVILSEKEEIGAIDAGATVQAFEELMTA